MKLHELKATNQEIIEAKLVQDVQLHIQEQVILWREQTQCYLEQNQVVCPIEIQATSTQPKSLVETMIEQPNLLWTLTRQKDKQLWLTAIQFDGNLSLDLDIGVDDYICQQLVDNHHISDLQLSMAIDWLNEEFFLDQDESIHLAFSIVYSNQDTKTISLLGKSHLLEIKAINDYWQITKLTQRRPQGHFKMMILCGGLQFKDASLAQELSSPTAKAALQQALHNHGDYIATWEQYNDAQWEKEVTRSNEIGYLEYAKFESAPKAGEWFLYINDPDKLQTFKKTWENFDRKKDEQVQLDTQLPDWFDNESDLADTGLDKITKAWRGEILAIDCNKNRILLKYAEKYEKNPPNKGFLFLSIYSIRVQRQRQKNALELIQTHQNPMGASLHYLLQGIAVPSIRTHKFKWSSTKTKTLFKGGKPTPKQQQAIELGLNCTDVAIIIGPPGTGKTQVITALQQRIVEEQDTHIQRSVLLTSYQHDAVDNVIARSDVLGLAGLRIGGKKKTDDDDIAGLDTIAKWATPIQNQLSDIIQQNNYIQLIKKLEDCTLVLRLGNSQQKNQSILQINEILSQISKTYKIFPSLEWQHWWEQFDSKSSSITASVLAQDYPVICSLRTTATSFADDGVQRCIYVLAHLQVRQQQNPNIPILLADEIEVLKQFIKLDMTAIEKTDFTALIQVKNTLLDRCLPDFRPLHIQTMLSEQDCKRLDQLHQDIYEKAKKTNSLGYLMVLEKYRLGLSATTGTIKDAISHYTAVLGATCQQAVGNAMQNLKLIGTENRIIFENVIVDEAARATPLDLMIPMSMAKRRLILVGDHRQLPHMLDDKVEKALSQQKEWEIVQSEMLKQSLFQRLVENLKRLEDEQQQPKRVIMLDTQFRMHKILGKFISENFYEKHGLPPIQSKGPNSDFIPNISGYAQRVCAFKDIQGEKQQFVNGSWHRPTEAQWIAQEAKRILDEKPELSVGIISFYSHQVGTLFKAMSDPKIGLTTHDKIVESYRIIESGENKGDERLRIGTVDAFQGKEFDVVFVSLVRTIPEDFNLDGLSNLQRDQQLTKAYGFLRVDNRLNVALSRQRSLLIVVGDSNFVQHEITAEAVPALPKFFELCRGEHV